MAYFGIDQFCAGRNHAFKKIVRGMLGIPAARAIRWYARLSGAGAKINPAASSSSLMSELGAVASAFKLDEGKDYSLRRQLKPIPKLCSGKSAPPVQQNSLRIQMAGRKSTTEPTQSRSCLLRVTIERQNYRLTQRKR